MGIERGLELVQTEDRFTDIKDALRTMNKMDFDKLVASVIIFRHSNSSSVKPYFLYAAGSIGGSGLQLSQVSCCSCISDAQSTQYRSQSSSAAESPRREQITPTADHP